MADIPLPKFETLAIVAIGSFNPAIFHPAWFSSHDLIRKEEFDSARIEIVHKEVSHFATEWFSLQVTSDRFALETGDPAKSPSLRDLAVSTFTLLEHTPIHQVGLNRARHFQMASIDEWHGFGHFFAPKVVWADLLINPGLQSLTIAGKRERSKADPVSIRIEPSAQISPGVFIHVNEHFKLGIDTADESPPSPLAFVRLLQSSWDDFLSYSADVSTHLFAKYRERSV